MEKRTLGDEEKDYEDVYDFRLLPRAPIILRADGVSFSNFTKRLKLEKPFDKKFSTWMSEATVFAASKIQGCVLGYTQSDEITLVIKTDQSEETTPWFSNRIQKIDSVVAGMLSASFMRAMLDTYDEPSMAYFDCRVGSRPDMDRVVGSLIWRQRDCVKNSISSAVYYELGKKVGRGTARKMLHQLNSKERQELLFKECGINWATYEESFKNGIVVYRKEIEVDTEHGKVLRKKWVFDAAPVFTSDVGREWLYRILHPEDDYGEEEEAEIQPSEDASQDKA